MNGNRIERTIAVDAVALVCVCEFQFDSNKKKYRKRMQY